MPELKSREKLAPSINDSEYIYYDLRKRETNELAMCLITTKKSLFSSFNNDSRWLSQPENYTYCRKLYYIYYHKDDISIVKNIKCCLGRQCRFHRFSMD